jgi:hypothetical protein
MLEAIKFAEANRGDVLRLSRPIRDRVERQLGRTYRVRRASPPTKREVDVAADVAAVRDAYVRLAIANERWGGRLTVMYGVAELVAQQHVTNHLLGELINALNTFIDSHRSHQSPQPV